MAAVDQTPPRRGAPAELPPAQVPGNAWTAIAVAALGDLAAARKVSVVVGGADPDELLPLTLASLSAQTYPADLTEILVEHGRAGAGAPGGPPVRAVGSLDEAEGEILLLVEAGSVAEPRLVEAHARWHHAVADAVSVGLERTVDASGLGADEVRAAVAAGELGELIAPRARDSEGVRALEAYLERTRQLTEPDPDLFWVAACGTVGMRRETWKRAGGLSGERDAHVARLDVAWRLATAGTVIVPERDAVTYAGYDRAPAPPRAGNGAAAAREPRAAALIPSPGYRVRESGRLRRRPAMLVSVPVREEPAADVLDTLDAILRGRFCDLEVRLAVPAAHPERGLIELVCEADPRVSLVAPGGGTAHVDARVQVTVPPVAVLGEGTLADLYELVVHEGVGAVHVSIPGRLGRLRRGGEPRRLSRRPAIEARATGMLARARRVAEHRGDSGPDAVTAELFGERAIPGATLEVHRRGSPAPRHSADEDAPPAGDLARERAEHLRNRARAATNQARLDRRTQLLTRERMRATNERVRADRLEARLALISPRVWARWRSRQATRRVKALPERASGAADVPRRAALRARQVAVAAVAKRRS